MHGVDKQKSAGVVSTFYTLLEEIYTSFVPASLVSVICFSSFAFADYFSMTGQKTGGGAMMDLLVVTILYMLYASHTCRCLSTFHKDAAFTYVNVANNPTTYPLDPADADVQPLLDRNAQTELFTAPIPGTYVFTFTAGKNVRGKSKVTHYKLIKEGVAVEVLFRLTVNGPAFAHTVVDLDQGDKVYVSTYAQPPAVPIVPDASLESPVIFSGFNLYRK